MNQISRLPLKTGRILGATTLGAFLKAEFPIDEELLGEVILAKTIGMLAGPRGSGKSWLAMIIAYAVAGNKALEPWGTGLGVPVAILDGEMRAAGLQERLRLIHAFNGDQQSKIAAEQNLHIISRDCAGDAIGSIDTEEGRDRIDALIPQGVRLIVLDNLSAWTSGGREDSHSWAAIKNWLVTKRLEGVAVLLIHHTGKNGQQRGSSAHEDSLDYSMLLSPLPSSAEVPDTRFSIEHTKLRDFVPKLRQKYECSIWSKNDKLQFNIVAENFQLTELEGEMLRLRDENVSMEEIGRRLKVSKSTVSRALKKLQAVAGDVKNPPAE
jgi:putative DNA primase/helicase